MISVGTPKPPNFRHARLQGVVYRQTYGMLIPKLQDPLFDFGPTQRSTPTMCPSDMDSSGKTSNLTLAPVKPDLGLSSTSAPPALPAAVYFVEDKAHLLKIDIPNKKRTPLPNSRPSRPLTVYAEDVSSKYPSNGRKRALGSGEGEDEADCDIRAAKRSCPIPQSAPTNVAWSLDENKEIKPPVSFVQLARVAILNSEEQVLTLDGIVASIKTEYAYYHLLHSDKAWKASIYNGLRSSKAFEKVGKSTVIKTQKWQVKAEYHSEDMPVRKHTCKRRSPVPFAVRFVRPYTWSNPPS